MKAGDRGFCFVRQNVDGEMVLTTYGRSTGFCIDPIEKKPLNHFYPGSSVLSFGTAGCNLGCKFCQNWDISKSREVERLSELAMPDAVAQAALDHGCRSVAYTYNDPVIWAEYAIDTARACRAVGVKNVAVTAGYISPSARASFYEPIDAANVDLKGFTEEFYYRVTYSHLQPVLETLEWLKRETAVWFEITNLVIPQTNDNPDDLRRMCDWILTHVGDDVPVHFSAFHPDYRMQDLPNTPLETLLTAHEIARQVGLRYVYVGNVNDVRHQSTYCHACGGLLIERNWYALGEYKIRQGACGHCGVPVAGHFAERPGDWGRKRQPIRIANYAKSRPLVVLQTVPSYNAPSAATPTLKGSSMNPAAPAPSPLRERPELTSSQQQAIQRAANELVAAPICARPVRLADPTLSGAAGFTVMGAFVTLKRRGHLRACCGTLGKPMPLLDALRQSAHRTATEDVRLPPISLTELPFLDLDVSLLYGFEPMRARGRQRIAEVVPGRHGLQIRRGDAGGLLLPSVAIEQQWDAETFLRQVCKKAGLPTTAWEEDDTQILTFESVAFGGPFDSGVLASDDAARSTASMSDEELQALERHCRSNLLALLAGATPSYYLFGVPDGTVQGVSLSARVDPQSDWLHVAQLSLRPGLPLQTTAFQLCEGLARALPPAVVARRENLELNLAVLQDSAMHGTVTDPDLRGVDTARRAILVMDRGRSAWAVDPAQSAEQLFRIAVEDCKVSHPENASVVSLAAQTVHTPLRISTAPRAVTGPRIRPPAVAGTFYPAQTGALQNMLDELLDPAPPPPEQWPAIMVPHAGLRYSGKLAATVFQQVQIPGTVLILSPKHTRLGVEWAVAPHEIWQIPGADVPSDHGLAEQLAAAIPGLELDSAAHQQEHGIELELPWIARLAPGTKVVGIAIGGGSLESCRQFATGLARLLRTLPQQPLLVISSDMNHFATDSENRRLDEIALRAMESLRPEELFDVVTRHNISMCGLLPAVIVMETLRQLGRLKTCRRVGYATSADVTGDTDRVVGYAGMLLK